MATKLKYNVGDRVECRNDADGKFYGTIVGRGPTKSRDIYDCASQRAYDVKREDGIDGFGIRHSWRLTAGGEYGRVLRRRPKLKSKRKAA